MALDATPKSANANSFTTLAFATDYLANDRRYAAAWATIATDADREAYLKWATSLLDLGFDFPGSIAQLDQALSWPRVGVTDREGRYVNQDTVPVLVQQATALMAYYLSQSDRTKLPDLITKGFSRVKAGSVEIEINPSLITPLIPPEITLMLAQLGGSMVNQAQFTGSRCVMLTRV